MPLPLVAAGHPMVSSRRSRPFPTTTTSPRRTSQTPSRAIRPRWCTRRQELRAYRLGLAVLLVELGLGAAGAKRSRGRHRSSTGSPTARVSQHHRIGAPSTGGAAGARGAMPIRLGQAPSTACALRRSRSRGRQSPRTNPSAARAYQRPQMGAAHVVARTTSSSACSLKSCNNASISAAQPSAGTDLPSRRSRAPLLTSRRGTQR
mmetsp:Transcript_131719/g.281641  ORF Transcript_131719/g.281641 Transcript_131719/m.281641 type:complete len:205 (-) Transcript_131719:207-821(-)